jgi:hypothetical protein
MEDVREILSAKFHQINHKDEVYPFHVPSYPPTHQVDFTPLMWASKENHLQILIALLEYGADVNAQTEVFLLHFFPFPLLPPAHKS